MMMMMMMMLMFYVYWEHPVINGLIIGENSRDLVLVRAICLTHIIDVVTGNTEPQQSMSNYYKIIQQQKI